MDFEVVVVCLKILFLHLTANTEATSESNYLSEQNSVQTNSIHIFQPGTCRMQGVIATVCLFRMPGLYLRVNEGVFAYRGHLN
jgi:hypothetical protein